MISGRGVTYFDGRIRCPYAGLGARGDQASNRLALDDGESQVTIDRDAPPHHRREHAPLPVQANHRRSDLPRHRQGRSGARVPLAVHLKLEKKKAKISIDLHPHWTMRGKLTAPELDPFEVVYNDGATEKVVATGDDLLRAATETKLWYTIAGALIEVKDNLEGRPPPSPRGRAGRPVARHRHQPHQQDVRSGPRCARSTPPTPRSPVSRRRPCWRAAAGSFA